MKLTVIPVVIGALGSVIKGLVQGMENLLGLHLPVIK